MSSKEFQFGNTPVDTRIIGSFGDLDDPSFADSLDGIAEDAFRYFREEIVKDIMSKDGNIVLGKVRNFIRARVDFLIVRLLMQVAEKELDEEGRYKEDIRERIIKVLGNNFNAAVDRDLFRAMLHGRVIKNNLDMRGFYNEVAEHYQNRTFSVKKSRSYSLNNIGSLNILREFIEEQILCGLSGEEIFINIRNFFGLQYQGEYHNIITKKILEAPNKLSVPSYLLVAPEMVKAAATEKSAHTHRGNVARKEEEKERYREALIRYNRELIDHIRRLANQLRLSNLDLKNAYFDDNDEIKVLEFKNSTLGKIKEELKRQVDQLQNTRSQPSGMRMSLSLHLTGSTDDRAPKEDIIVRLIRELEETIKRVNAGNL